MRRRNQPEHQLAKVAHGLYVVSPRALGQEDFLRRLQLLPRQVEQLEKGILFFTHGR